MGKGSRQRRTDHSKYGAEYDRIFNSVHRRNKEGIVLEQEEAGCTVETHRLPIQGSGEVQGDERGSVQEVH